MWIGDAATEVAVHDDGAGVFLAHRDDIEDAGATEMKNALAQAAADYANGDLAVSEVDHAFFDEEYSPAEAVSFSFRDGRLLIDIGFFVDDFDEAEVIAPEVQRTVAPLLERHRAVFVSAEVDEHYAASPWLCHLTIAPQLRGRTMGDIYDVGKAALALLDAATGVGLRPSTVLDLLRGSRAEVLIGQPEGDWLDVKRQDYELASDAGKISLAQDVARFANGEYGGLVVVGMGAKKVGDAEVIRSLHPLPKNPHGVRRHRQAIDQRVFPPLDGMTIEEVPVPGGHLVLINVPPQPEELKPFLVHGAIVGGRVEAAFISIVRRRGEASIPISAAAIHSMLAAGRALLRRGVLPDDEENP